MNLHTAQEWHVLSLTVHGRALVGLPQLRQASSCVTPQCHRTNTNSVHTTSTPRVQICENDEQKMGADIVRKALPYALKLISHNAGVNGSVVMDKVLSKSDDVNWGYNAATDVYEDLMKVGIIDPTKVRAQPGKWLFWYDG